MPTDQPMTPTLRGGCQCGTVRYALTGAPVLTAICHCSMCRRANAAPAVAWAMYTLEQVSFTNRAPSEYASSAQARRGFCPRCGTQICFTAEYIPGLIDITIGSLDDPEQLEPAFHYWYARHLSWVRIDDGLPKHPEFPPLSEPDGAA